MAHRVINIDRLITGVEIDPLTIELRNLTMNYFRTNHCDQTVEVRVDPSQSPAQVTVAVDLKHCDQTVEAISNPSQSSTKVNVAIDIKHCDQTVEATEAVGIGSSSQATPSVCRKRAAASLSEQDVPPSKRSKTKNHDKIVKAMVDYFTTCGHTDDLKSCLWDVLKESLSDTRGRSIINAFMGLSFDQVRQGLRMMLEDRDAELNSAFLTLIRSAVRINKDLPAALISPW
ncbi:hypothetical protein LTS15_011073 [Exophiala xenobiotica]|nr:hypothetical protein LTS15_011073 [Exophiala xenobiotica]